MFKDLPFQLDPPPRFKLPVHPIEARTTELQGIAARNAKRVEGESPALKDRKDEMRKALRTGTRLEELAAHLGGERILLSIYTDDLTRAGSETWLPAFDPIVCRLLLGTDGTLWTSPRLRQATMLFFAHCGHDRFSGANALCNMLRMAHAKSGDGPWSRHAGILFNEDGPSRIASKADSSQTVETLLLGFRIPEGSRFAELLRTEVLLAKLVRLSLNEDPSGLMVQIESQRTRSIGGGVCLGAKALQIMIGKVQQNRESWPKNWAAWIRPLGGDPRQAHRPEWAMYWSWALPKTSRAYTTAVNGMNAWTVKEFVEHLQASLISKEEDFRERSEFLLYLLESGKIKGARLVLNGNCYQNLPQKLKDTETVAVLSKTTWETSLICLQCIDDIYIVEGTHTFALRMYKKTFPVFGFWDPQFQKEVYKDSDFRSSPRTFDQKSSLFLAHLGDWRAKFFWHLRHHHHLEWEGR